MLYRWQFPEAPDMDAVLSIESGMESSRVIARLLVQRGFRDPGEARNFLEPDLVISGHDPFLMNGMEMACRRLKEARNRGEVILVHGDYDVDGITSTAMLTRFFESLDVACSPYIPRRLIEGYGLSRLAVDEAVARGASLIVTADCGVNAIEPVRYATEKGVEVIVTDHHQPGEELPEARAVLDPNREDCRYPDKGLAGVGVAWKLCHGLHLYLNREGDDPDRYLDLVCLGSIADAVPVQGENRAIMRHGLDRILKGNRVGTRALLEYSSLKRDSLTYRDVAFVLAPRINAAGRLGEAYRAFRLLYTDDEDEAREHAEWLEEENNRRRVIESNVSEEVREILSREFDNRRHYAVVLASRNWHPGVIGIVASRVVDEYSRPVVLISIDSEGIGRGSARSISDFSIYRALADCSSLLIQYGGHNYAAGLKIEASKIEAFRHAFQDVAREALEGRDLLPVLHLDLEIEVGDVSPKLVEELRMLEPFGPGNPEPLFCLRDGLVVDHPRILGRNTLKFSVKKDGRTIEVVGFGKGDYLERVKKGAKIDIAARIEEDEWRGVRRIGMKFEDIRTKST
jgi:single-stranded-DNA-specific exonuclease